MSESDNGKVLEMHVEVPPGQTLGAAHEQVSRLEQDVRTNLPDVADVITHIEPAMREADAGGSESIMSQAEELKKRALDLLQTQNRLQPGSWIDMESFSGTGETLIKGAMGSMVGIFAPSRLDRWPTVEPGDSFFLKDLKFLSRRGMTRMGKPGKGKKGAMTSDSTAARQHQHEHQHR